jgi:rod shape-determining protein MreD
LNWIVFIFIAYVTLGLQLGLGGVLQWGHWMPSLPLMLVLFMSLHAPMRYALSSCLIVGLGHDLISSAGLGTYVFSYGLVGLVVLQLRLLLYREHALTHVTLGFLMGTLVAMLIAMQNILRTWLGHATSGATLGSGFATALTTTIASPLVIYLLRRIRRSFSFRANEVEM